MSPLRLGSLCTGTAALDMAVADVLDVETVWVADPDPGASALLAHRYPDVPNLGDITAVDWETVAPVDVLAGGFPCQDVSCAGRRDGIRAGNRSGLWAHFALAIDVLRPGLVVIENVGGLLSAAADSDVEPCPWCLGDPADEPHLRALGAVLGDLATLGFDAEWASLRASDVGAAHRRERVFILAWPADAASAGFEGPWLRGRPTGGGGAAADPDRLGDERDGTGGQPAQRHAQGAGGVAADAARVDQREQADETLPVADGGEPRPELGGRGVRVGAVARTTAADAEGDGRDERRTGTARQQGRPDAAVRRCVAPDAEGQRHRDGGPEGFGRLASTAIAGSPADTDRDALREQSEPHTGGSGSAVPGLPDIDWGPYRPAIDRWASVIGRPAPAPRLPTGRGGSDQLSPRFVEWLMGLPEGWVTAVPGLSRNAQLKALGNGVVWQQGAAALRLLLDRMTAVAVSKAGA